jgi:hypothetical protein
MSLLIQRPRADTAVFLPPFLFLFPSPVFPPSSCKQTTDKACIRTNAQVDFLDAVNVNGETGNLDPAMLEAASALLREGLRGGGGKLSEKSHLW